MAKKTQQHRSAPTKSVPQSTAANKARGAHGEAATEAGAPGNDTEQPRSETLRAAAADQVAADQVDDSAPVRWPNLPPGAREVLGLYEQRSGELCFPGVTFESLATQADRIDQLAENVEKARLELAAAQAAQGAAETEFVEATRRAFAYALVYAQEHAELRTELEKFVYASPDKPRRKKREAPDTQARGKRTAKAAAAGAETTGQAEG